MAHCGERSVVLFGQLCISHEDNIMIYFNLVCMTVIAGLFYLKGLLSKKHANLTSSIKHSFTILGEGPLNHFYTLSNTQQKSTNPKKKVQQKSAAPAVTAPDKSSSNNDLKCNSCNRDIKVSYQYTIHNLNPTN